MTGRSYSPRNWYHYPEDIDINFEEAGSGGAVIVFLPGFGDSLQVWNDVRANFNMFDYKLYFLELKGFGFSSKPEASDYSISEQAAIVLAFMRAHSLNNVTLIGHSYGGAVALSVQIRALQDGWSEIARLVLIDAAAYIQKIPTSIDLLRLPVINQFVSYLVPAGVKSLVVLLEVIHDRSRITRERIQMHAFYFALPGAKQSFIQAAKQLIPPDYEEMIDQYRNVTIPTLLIWGDRDRFIPLEVGVRLNDELEDSKLEVIENCGHAAHEERPNDVYGLITDFLES